MKNLSGTNIQAQKELAAYSPTILVILEADSPVGATSKYYASKKHTISGTPYLDFLESVGDIEMAIRAGGGLASVSGCDIGFRNEEGFANILDDYFLENDDVAISLIFRTGSETSADILNLFSGVVDDVSFDWSTFQLHCVDKNFAKDKIIPRERMDIIKYLYAPLDNIDKVIPVAFGRLNTGPFDDDGNGVHMAPCVCLDKFSLQYTPGYNCHTYGDAFVYYESAKRYGKIEEKSQSGDTFTIPSSKRFTVIRPVRELATNDVTDWWKTADLDTGTGCTLASGDDLDVAFAGCPQLGTIYDIKVAVYAAASAGNTFNYTISFAHYHESGTAGAIVNGGSTLTDSSKSWVVNDWAGKKVVLDPGGANEEEHVILSNTATVITISGTWSAPTASYAYQIRTADLTGTLGGSGATNYTVELDETEYADRWDFQNIEIKLERNAGSPQILETKLWVYFYEQESFGDYSLPVFQKVSGYKDTAARYADGSAITGEGTMLENPAHVLEAILRDKKIGLGLLAAQIDLTSLDDAATDLTGWKTAFSLREETKARDFVDKYAFQFKMRVFENYNGKTKVIVFDKADAPVSTFDAALNIAVENPESEPGQHRSSFSVSKTPMDELGNELEIKYRKDYATGDFAGLKIATGHYRTSGTTGNTSKATGKLTDSGATFVTDGVAVGDTILVVEDKSYTVTSVDSETQLGVSAVSGEINDNTNATYYIGPYLDYDCWDSEQRYKTTNNLLIEAEFLGDSTTAGYVKSYFLSYFVYRLLMVRFKTWFNACDLEVGDFVWILNDCLPSGKRPKALDTLNGAINNSTISVIVDHGTRFRADDYILIDHEIMLIGSIAGNTLTVTRAQSQTSAAAHADGATVSRLETKFEVIRIKYLPRIEDAMIELTCREVPQWYLPTGHWAPDAVPTWDNAADDQKLWYGFWTYENDRVKYYGAETEVSHWEA